MSRCCIVVPVYKDFKDLTANELLSLEQLYQVLYKHDIYFAGPSSLQWHSYTKHATSYPVIIAIKKFDPSFFDGIPGYNQLLLSKEFYNSFRQYDYMLIYQPDAFVFRDELEYWCNKGYDYIGAPWFEGFDKPQNEKKIIGMGNGGFSLRNVSTFLRLLRRINTLKKLRQFWYRSYFQAIIRFEWLIVHSNNFKIKSLQSLPVIFFGSLMNEDYFWTHIPANLFRDYKVAPSGIAIKFSFEVNPSLLFKMNNEQLPFGCHAWERYDPIFWKQFIEF